MGCYDDRHVFLYLAGQAIFRAYCVGENFVPVKAMDFHWLFHVLTLTSTEMLDSDWPMKQTPRHAYQNGMLQRNRVISLVN